MQCDLHAALAEEALQEQLSWRNQGHLIALDIARGLSYLHTTMKAIHFDLKVRARLLCACFRAMLACNH